MLLAKKKQFCKYKKLNSFSFDLFADKTLIVDLLPYEDGTVFCQGWCKN